MTTLTKKLAFSGVAVALAAITSNIRFFKLPMGGSVSLMSMLFICLVGCWFGLVWGMAAGVAFGLLQFVFDPYFLSVPQFFCDYIFSFASLGLAGFVHHVGALKKHPLRLQIGYLVGVFFRWVFAVISGVVFFASYAAEAGFDNPFLYSAVYNGSYIFAEAIITVIVISLPPVSKAINRISYPLLDSSSSASSSSSGA